VTIGPLKRALDRLVAESRHAARIGGSPLAMRLARGIAWSTAGAVIGRGLVSNMAVARMAAATMSRNVHASSGEPVDCETYPQ